MYLPDVVNWASKSVFEGNSSLFNKISQELDPRGSKLKETGTPPPLFVNTYLEKIFTENKLYIYILETFYYRYYI